MESERTQVHSCSHFDSNNGFGVGEARNTWLFEQVRPQRLIDRKYENCARWGLAARHEPVAIQKRTRNAGGQCQKNVQSTAISRNGK